MEEFRHKGVWWLPETPEEEVAGILTYSESDGVRLELIGSLEEPFAPTFLGQGLRTIHGMLANGKEVTLHRAFPTNQTIGSSGIPTASYYANLAVVGVHFDDESASVFRSVVSRTSYLDAWASQTGFAQPIIQNGSYNAQYTPIDDKLLYSSDEVSIFIEIRHLFVPDGHPLTKVVIEQYARIKVVAESVRPLDVFLEAVGRVEEVISLAASKPVKQLSLEATTPDGDEVQIYARHVSRDMVVERVHPRDLLFTLPDIEDTQVFFDQWFAKRTILKPVCDLFFGTQRNTNLYLENRFLSYAQALESYHRRMHNRPDLPPEEHRERLEAVLRSVPEQHGEWLRDKLNFSNELTLQTRLREILRLFPSVLEFFVSDEDQFVADIKNTRNYLTHYNRDLERRAVRGIALRQLLERMQLLLTLCLLHELGFSEEKLREFLGARGQYLDWVNGMWQSGASN